MRKSPCPVPVSFFPPVFKFRAVLCLRGCCSEWKLLSGCRVQGSHSGGFSCCGARALVSFRSCSSWAQWLRLLGSGAQTPSPWCACLVERHGGRPGPGMEPRSSAPPGRVSPTAPPEKSPFFPVFVSGNV